MKPLMNKNVYIMERMQYVLSSILWMFILKQILLIIEGKELLYCLFQNVKESILNWGGCLG